MRIVISILGTMASGMLALFWTIGWILRRGADGAPDGLNPLPPLELAGMAVLAALVHLVQLGFVIARRDTPKLIRAALWVLAMIAGVIGTAIALAAPETAEFWPVCLVAAAMNVLCAVMPRQQTEDNA